MKDTYTILELCKILKRPPNYVWRIINYFKVPYVHSDDGYVVNKLIMDYVISKLRIGDVNGNEKEETKEKKVQSKNDVGGGAGNSDAGVASGNESSTEAAAKEDSIKSSNIGRHEKKNRNR